MSDKSDPAFPQVFSEPHYTNQGMTLRDYLAAKAMQGLLSNPEAIGIMNAESTDKDEYACDTTARLAYEYADAMLKERAK